MKNWEKNIRIVTPYTPGEQPHDADMIKLNTNENPYPPSPYVQEALCGLRAEEQRFYPDPSAECLVCALAETYGLKKEQVFVGVGSDDVLALAFLTFFHSGKPILFPDITYSFYEVWANLFEIPFVRPALNDRFEIEAGDYCRENGGIIFPNPNAPTGVELPQSEIERILQANPDVIVIVDEAYIDFGGTSALPLIGRYENLLVVQTFSKSRSMAGMRIGCAMGSERLIAYLNHVKYSFNSYTMSRAALAAGTAALRDEAYFRETMARIVDTREWTKGELRRLGFSFPDSQANFIFAAHESCPAKELYEALRGAHIYVRYFEAPRTGRHLRITIGTREQMEELLRFLSDYLGSRK